LLQGLHKQIAAAGRSERTVRQQAHMLTARRASVRADLARLSTAPVQNAPEARAVGTALRGD
jgi:hypothetical protein